MTQIGDGYAAAEIQIAFPVFRAEPGARAAHEFEIEAGIGRHHRFDHGNHPHFRTFLEIKKGLRAGFCPPSRSRLSNLRAFLSNPAFVLPRYCITIPGERCG